MKHWAKTYHWTVSTFFQVQDVFRQNNFSYPQVLIPRDELLAGQPRMVVEIKEDTIAFEKAFSTTCCLTSKSKLEEQLQPLVKTSQNSSPSKGEIATEPLKPPSWKRPVVAASPLLESSSLFERRLLLARGGLYRRIRFTGQYCQLDGLFNTKVRLARKTIEEINFESTGLLQNEGFIGSVAILPLLGHEFWEVLTWGCSLYFFYFLTTIKVGNTEPVVPKKQPVSILRTTPLSFSFVGY